MTVVAVILSVPPCLLLALSGFDAPLSVRGLLSLLAFTSLAIGEMQLLVRPTQLAWNLAAWAAGAATIFAGTAAAAPIVRGGMHGVNIADGFGLCLIGGSALTSALIAVLHVVLRPPRT